MTATVTVDVTIAIAAHVTDQSTASTVAAAVIIVAGETPAVRDAVSSGGGGGGRGGVAGQDGTHAKVQQSDSGQFRNNQQVPSIPRH